MRNLSIALAIAINAFGPQGSSAALVVAMAYIIQVQSAAWYVKFADTLFGKRDVVHRCPVPVMVVRLPRQQLHSRPQKPLKSNDLEERRTIGNSSRNDDYLQGWQRGKALYRASIRRNT